MSWLDYVNAAGIIGALGLSAYQTRRLASEARTRDQERRAEQSLELYRDFVIEGSTAEAVNRMSVLLRKTGTEMFGTSTWFCMTDDDFGPGRLLDASDLGLTTPFQDLYRILFFFERTEGSLRYGFVDSDVLFSTVGFHIWWWSQLLWEVTGPKASVSLHSLAPVVQAWSQSQVVDVAPCSTLLELWHSRCGTDFNGVGPRDFGSPAA
jgi:hypothetical protein